jgi:hypothetical protein
VGSACLTRRCRHLASAPQQCALSQCIVFERVFGIEEYCCGSAALCLPDLPSCDFFSSWGLKTASEDIILRWSTSDALWDLTEEDFQQCFQDGRTASNSVLL